MENLLNSLTLLTPDRRAKVLSDLILHLGIAARGAYYRGEEDGAKAAARLEAFNEMGILVADQLRSGLRVDADARPDKSFVEALSHWAAIGGCEPELRWVIEKVLAEVPRSG